MPKKATVISDSNTGFFFHSERVKWECYFLVPHKKVTKEGGLRGRYGQMRPP